MRRLSIVLTLMLVTTPVAAFDRSLWQSPNISDKSGVTEIRIESAPAGLFLREKLDPKKRYKLRVKGTGEPITMRLQIDDKAYAYIAAPLGVTDRTIAGASRLELLFYSDKPASYRLKSAEIEECSECRTAEEHYSKRFRRTIGMRPTSRLITSFCSASCLRVFSVLVRQSTHLPATDLLPC